MNKLTIKHGSKKINVSTCSFILNAMLNNGDKIYYYSSLYRQSILSVTYATSGYTREFKNVHSADFMAGKYKGVMLTINELKESFKNA